MAIYSSNVRLRASRERMRDFINNVDLVIQIVDAKGRFLFVNQAWQKTLGYSETEAKGLNLFDIMHPKHLEDCKHTFDALFSRKQESATIETILISKDEKPIYLKGETSLQIKDGKSISTRSVFQNIATERDAEYLRKLTKNIFENTTDGVIATDKRGVIQFYNTGFTQITGYKDEIIGKNIELIFPPVIADKNLTMQIPRNLLQKKSWQGEVWSRNTEGEAYFLRININAIYDKNGDVSNFAGIITDITEEKEKEKLLYRLAMPAILNMNRTYFI
ncbi:MAG: PAS domain S-box protein [Anaerolineae bacterium]|nr:PAS domain S-box protein [Anaerolineae bacterium]